MRPDLEARMIAIDEYFEKRQAKPLPLEFYMIALVGEVGEAFNLFKKGMRGDYALPFHFEHEGQQVLTIQGKDFALELADIEIYLRHLARKTKIDLDAAVAEKIGICEKRWNIPEATNGG